MEHIITTPEQLQILIGNTVEQSVRNALDTLVKPKDPEPKTEEKLLTTRDICKLFSKTKCTIISWRKKGILKAYKISGRIYFKEREALAALERLEIE